MSEPADHGDDHQDGDPAGHPSDHPADHGDEGLLEVLHYLGVAPAALLGSGLEASVYALDDERVVRVSHSRSKGDETGRSGLVDELCRNGSPFLLPAVLDSGSVGTREYRIERRLPGRSVAAQLAHLDRRGRDELVTAHLDAAAALGDLHLDRRDWFGDLIGPDAVRTETWRGYLVEKVAARLDRVQGFEHLDAEELSAGLPDCEQGRFVHMDAFAENMLAVGSEITAVIDIGATSVVGDRRLDPLAAAVYFCSEPITPRADDADRRVVQGWLKNAGLAEWFEPARRWTAAYWARATEDPTLHAWCRSVLL